MTIDFSKVKYRENDEITYSAFANYCKALKNIFRIKTMQVHGGGKHEVGSKKVFKIINLNDEKLKKLFIDERVPGEYIIHKQEEQPEKEYQPKDEQKQNWIWRSNSKLQNMW